jgi:hypothetical protein
VQWECNEVLWSKFTYKAYKKSVECYMKTTFKIMSILHTHTHITTSVCMFKNNHLCVVSYPLPSYVYVCVCESMCVFQHCRGKGRRGYPCTNWPLQVLLHIISSGCNNIPLFSSLWVYTYGKYTYTCIHVYMKIYITHIHVHTITF